MDGGPFRVPRPADRQASVGRPEATQRQAVEPQSEYVEPKAAHRAAAPRHIAESKKSFKRFILPLVIAAVIVVIGVVGWFVWSGSRKDVGATAIDTSKYQAVFFTNGQVYFGKLTSFNSEYMKLTDIYYLQTQTTGEADAKNPQQTSTDQKDVQLIKLGDEIHGPEDEMVISKDQMLFYENLKADGKVAQSIDKFKGANK